MSKTALVTGSAGFVGRAMVRELESRGYDVAGIDVNGHRWYHHPQGWFHEDAVSLFGDPKFDVRYDLVAHCAYHVGGRVAIDGVNTNFAKNLALDAALFEWAVRTKQRRLLYFSSSAAYPVALQAKDYYDHMMSEDWGPEANEEWGWREHGLRLHEDSIDPNAPWLPDASYGWAKLTGERLAEDARRNGLAVTVVRPASGYGPDQSLDYPWNSILGRVKNGDYSVFGNPQQTRDWIFQSDVINGALAVVESEATDPVNLATGVPTTMEQLVRMAAKHLGHDPDFEVRSIPGPEGVFYRVLDPTRLHKYYVPTVSVEEGIERTYDAAS